WPGDTWPEDLTLEQDLVDLGWHQREFQMRRSFAYTVVTPSESQVIGCVYINPTQKRGYDAEIYLWARQSMLAGGLETRLHLAVKEWLAREWPFKKVGFPGRDIKWDDWRAIPVEERYRGTMTTSYKPEAYSTVSPYLIVEGASRTIDFLKRAFD